LIRRFEAEFEDRSVIPGDPVLAFLNYLLEDYADEWLTKAMFHYRWRFADDIDKAGTILPMWRGISAAPDALQAARDYISRRQIERLYVVGSNDTTAPVIEESYRRFLRVFDGLLQKQPFLFGDRPSSADFAVYAQLTQLATFDPTPSAVCLREAPRVRAWTDLLEDLSGTPATPDAWMPRQRAAGVFGDLLNEVGRGYAPVMLANAAALSAGEAELAATVDGRPWTQPVFPYQGKCLGWLRDEFSALDAADRGAVEMLLQGSGCERLVGAAA
jgi:glutathione S-transferase